MAFLESVSVSATEKVAQVASTFPAGITPFNGGLLLVATVLAVRAFVPPRPLPQPENTAQAARENKRRSRRRGLSRLSNTVQMLTGLQQRPAPVAAPAQSAPPYTAPPQSTRLLQGAFTALLDEVFVFDPKTLAISFMNSKAEKRVKSMGLKKTKVSFPNLLPEGNRSVILEAARNLQHSSLDTIVFELASDESPIELTLKLIREKDEPEYFMAIMRDVSGRVTEARAQSEYVATLSHEMRTPLTSIKGAVDLIASGKLGDLSGGAAMTLGVAQRNVDRLLRLTNDILDLEKMDAGKMHCMLEPVALTALVTEAAQDIQEYARQFDVSVNVEAGDMDDSSVLADRTRLLQVMANLLSNAIKHSAPQDEVCVRVEDQGGQFRVSVVDCGPGIPDTVEHDLFEPFLQGPQVQRKVASTGLGLSIAKRIVEAHSGTIGYESVPDQGATFFFEIPKLDTAEEEAA